MRRHSVEDCFWLDFEDNATLIAEALASCRHHDAVDDEAWFKSLVGFMATVCAPSEVLATWTVADALTHSKLIGSKSEATRKIKEGAVKINGKQVKSNRLLQADDTAFSAFSLLGIGKSNRALLLWASDAQMASLELLFWIQRRGAHE